jgi:S1-C subfamily serine protease
MVRAVVFAMLCFVVPGADSSQALSVLHIKAVLIDSEGRPTPVPNHRLLVSDNPPSASPRLVVTKLDGTADVNLRPGSYTVESDRAVVFEGKAYQWTQIVAIATGRDAVLVLKADNAEVEPAGAATATSGAPPASDPSFLAHQWRDSVVAIWSPAAHASGFLVDAKGLIATNQRVIGMAASVEVQLGPDLKVAASVLVADPVRDVAVVWVDPTVVASVRPVPLGCGQAAGPPAVSGQQIFTIGVPLRRQKDMTSGTVSRVEPHAIVSDLVLASGSAGGPVFAADGTVVGITSVAGEKDGDTRFTTRVVRIEDACQVVASAEKKTNGAAPPRATRLPVEPVQAFPDSALEEASRRPARGPKPYSMVSSAFDVVFITPVLTYSGQHQSEQARGDERSGGARVPDAGQAFLRAITDFGAWAEYVGQFPPVLMVRTTPKLVEGFWTKVARGAARTQGVSIPPIMRFKSSFSRMRVFCGDVEVTPIHPFTLELRVSDKVTIHEGLYVFDPGALGPHCATVRLVLYSDDEPEKGDVRVVDSGVVQRIWQDFAPYRVLSR